MRTIKKTRKQIAKGNQRLAVITDGCNPELVENADFDGILEIPIIKRPKEFKIPRAIVPFSRMEAVEPERFAVCEYENDRNFAELLRDPEPFVKELRKYQAFITPDASMYWDMPLAAQIVNKYRNHAIGCYMQSRGIYTIPNVRWGDERTYTTEVLPEKLAFLGVEKNSIVSIGSYGVVKSKQEKEHFRAGLESMLETLAPEVVLVYGSMPDDVFKVFKHKAFFIQYPDWTTYVRSEEDK